MKTFTILFIIFMLILIAWNWTNQPKQSRWLDTGKHTSTVDPKVEQAIIKATGSELSVTNEAAQVWYRVYTTALSKGTRIDWAVKAANNAVEACYPKRK